MNTYKVKKKVAIFFIIFTSVILHIHLSANERLYRKKPVLQRRLSPQALQRREERRMQAQAALAAKMEEEKIKQDLLEKSIPQSAQSEPAQQPSMEQVEAIQQMQAPEKKKAGPGVLTMAYLYLLDSADKALGTGIGSSAK